MDFSYLGKGLNPEPPLINTLLIIRFVPRAIRYRIHAEAAAATFVVLLTPSTM